MRWWVRLLHLGPLTSKALVAAQAMSMNSNIAVLPMRLFGTIVFAASGCPVVLSAVRG